MNRQETIAILGVLKAAYPNFYRGMGKADLEGVVNLWWDMFKEDDPSLVAVAVKAHIATDDKGYPPHVGAIKNALVCLKTPKRATEQEAWNLVKKATRNSTYGSREEFEKLPPMVQKLVGSPAQLREWGMMDTETLNSVVASNFMRSYKVLENREKEQIALPTEVKKALGSFTAFALEEWHE